MYIFQTGQKGKQYKLGYPPVVTEVMPKVSTLIFLGSGPEAALQIRWYSITFQYISVPTVEQNHKDSNFIFLGKALDFILIFHVIYCVKPQHFNIIDPRKKKRSHTQLKCFLDQWSKSPLSLFILFEKIYDDSWNGQRDLWSKPTFLVTTSFQNLKYCSLNRSENF